VREDGRVDGESVLLLHGFCSSMHSFDRLTEYLADTFRVIRMDLHGHGCTGGGAALLPQAQARSAASVLDALGVGEVAVLGHSFGADVAVALAESSRHVTSVILLAQAPDYSYARLPAGRWIMTVPLLGQVLHRIAVLSAVDGLARAAFARGPGPGIALDLDRPDRILLDRAATHPGMYRVVIADRARSLAERPLDRIVAGLPVPALAILGRHDDLFDCNMTAQRFAAVGAQVAVIEQAGHCPNIEAPREVASLVTDFLTMSNAEAA
jgi:pimeloyl-ACP methyl ester carboxylesterase